MKKAKCICTLLLICCCFLFSCTPANNTKPISEPKRRIPWERCCSLPTYVSFEEFDQMYDAIIAKEIFPKSHSSDHAQLQAACDFTYDAIWNAGTVPYLSAYRNGDEWIGYYRKNEYYIKPMTEDEPVTIYTAFDDPMNEDRQFRLSFQVKDSILVEQYNTMDKRCRFEIRIEGKQYAGLYWKTEEEIDYPPISHVAVDYGNYVLLLEGGHLSLSGETITVQEMCEVLHRLVIREENLWEPQPVC